LLSIFDGKMFDDWRIKMLAIFGFHDVAEVMCDRLVEIGSKATKEKKKSYKMMQKLNSKAHFLIY